MKSVLLALISTVVLGGVASAQPADPYYAPWGPQPAPVLAPPAAPMPAPAPMVAPMPPGAMRVPGPLRAALLARFDHNHDGRLEPNERRQAIRALRRLARQLAREERRAGIAQARARRAARQRPLDRDGAFDDTDF